jgi:pSer/pThr/pTyr-binding forkhead associated (FHA) protein
MAGPEPSTDAAPARPEAPATRLIVEAQIGLTRQRFVVTGDRASIGRPDPARGHEPEIDLRADDAVSRRHAEFRRGIVGWVVVDLGSTNGTRLNGAWLEAMSETPLADGDELEMGAATSLRVRVEQE